MKQPLVIRRVVGRSMLPTLLPGQIVLGWRFGKPKVGELIIFAHKGLEKIKRVSKIDSSNYFVLGDNPSESTDSRQFGPIKQPQITGRIIWPRNLKS